MIHFLAAAVLLVVASGDQEGHVVLFREAQVLPQHPSPQTQAEQ
jgi:hypothetical protein